MSRSEQNTDVLNLGVISRLLGTSTQKQRHTMVLSVLRGWGDAAAPC